jgi:UTP:GlnB (protein PII) uridylyltransferase
VGPSLFLEVRGPDRLGFLGSLLHALAGLELSPREMLITTRDGEAFDRFFLKTTSGAVPSPEVRHVLEAALEAAIHVPDVREAIA